MMQKRLSQLIVGDSEVAESLRAQIQRVAKYNVTVMATGPTGSGKELVARGVHMLSERPGRLVAVNCAAIPGELLEAELFGYEKGAFTGADRRREGRIEQAQGGTLFLDEIGDMPLELQAKLLRTLETRSVQRVGSKDEVAVDFRLICATHQNIDEKVRQNLFRADLLYRINVFPIDVPPLRDRKDDLLRLVEVLAMRLETDNTGLKPPVFGLDALSVLRQHDWPGNVRELRNVVERAAVLFPGQVISAFEVSKILPDKLTPKNEQSVLLEAVTSLPRTSGTELVHVDDDRATTDEIDALLDVPNFDLKAYLVARENRFIEAALDRTCHNIAQAAGLLGLRRTTLVEKMRKYGLNDANMVRKSFG